VAPEPSAAALAPGIRAGADHLISLGVTAWQEAALASFGSIPDFTDAYHLALAAGLRGRPTGAICASRPHRGRRRCLRRRRAERADAAHATGFPTRTAAHAGRIIESKTAALAYPDRSACAMSSCIVSSPR
jgi:hypothetical protein